MNLCRKTVFFWANNIELAKVSRKFERKVIELEQDRAKINENKSSISWSRLVWIAWNAKVEFQFGFRAENRIKDSMDAKMKRAEKFETPSIFSLETRQH